MTAIELRIGSIITDTHGRILTVVEIKQSGLRCEYEGEQNTAKKGIRNSLFPYSDLSGIPLTPQLLEKAGFVNSGLSGHFMNFKPGNFQFSNITVAQNTDTSEQQYYCFLRQGGFHQPREQDVIVTLRRNLKYVHELQNIIQSIFQVELPITL